jgi:hypothetical protein
VKRSRYRFASSHWYPVLTPGAQERHETTNWRVILAGILQIQELLSVILGLIQAHRNEIRAKPASAVRKHNRSAPSDVTLRPGLR